MEMGERRCYNKKNAVFARKAWSVWVHGMLNFKQCTGRVYWLLVRQWELACLTVMWPLAFKTMCRPPNTVQVVFLAGDPWWWHKTGWQSWELSTSPLHWEGRGWQAWARCASLRLSHFLNAPWWFRSVEPDPSFRSCSRARCSAAQAPWRIEAVTCWVLIRAKIFWKRHACEWNWTPTLFVHTVLTQQIQTALSE